MTQLQNSAFKVHSGSVPDVSKILPEPGAFIISEHDGNLYYADDFGWHQAEQPYSPITLFVDFNGVDQFAFRFKAPATSTLTFVDGDGTITEVAGQDDVTVTHTTNYSAAGKYYFVALGDVLDITNINIFNQIFVSGDISGWSRLIDITHIYVMETSVSGDIGKFRLLESIDTMFCYDTNVWGDISGFSELAATIKFLNCSNTKVKGDISGFYAMSSMAQIKLTNTLVTGDVSGFSAMNVATVVELINSGVSFDSIVTAWGITGTIDLTDCNLTPAMVDNALQSFVGCTGCNINLGGNNAKRTSASDAAFAIVDAANTLTVNS